MIFINMYKIVEQRLIQLIGIDYGCTTISYTIPIDGPMMRKARKKVYDVYVGFGTHDFQKQYFTH